MIAHNFDTSPRKDELNMSLVKLHQVNIVLANLQLHIEIHTRPRNGILMVRREVSQTNKHEEAYVFVNQSYLDKWIFNDPYYKFIPDAFEDLQKIAHEELFKQRMNLAHKSTHPLPSRSQQT